MPKFLGSADRCAGLADAYGEIARTHNCKLFDAGLVTTTSAQDGVHLDADQHTVLGEALAWTVLPTLSRA